MRRKEFHLNKYIENYIQKEMDRAAVQSASRYTRLQLSSREMQVCLTCILMVVKRPCKNKRPYKFPVGTCMSQDHCKRVRNVQIPEYHGRGIITYQRTLAKTEF